MDGIKPSADFGLRIADLMREVQPASGAAVRSDEKKQQVAHDFESVLLTRLFNQVQQSLGQWDLEEDGTSRQVQGLFWFYLAREVSDQGGVGLWKDIYQQLQQLDGVPNPADVLNEEL
jgi:Rod binding domain-containing protein